MLFEALGAVYLPPELRHRSGLVDLVLSGDSGVSERLAEIVSPHDIKGDLHVHTTWSDGVSSIEEMVVSARSRGYDYIAITDHATEIKMIHGLTEERLSAQIAEIEGLRLKYPTSRFLTGCPEVDILMMAGSTSLTRPYPNSMSWWHRSTRMSVIPRARTW
jgi:DNA polymerase (family 10)